MGTNDWQLNWRPQTPDYSEGLRGLGDSLGSLAEFKQKQRAAAEYAKQNRLAEARLKMQDEANKLKEAQGNADREGKLGGEVLDAFGKGGATYARARARLYKYRNPNTGQEHGFDFDPGEDPALDMPAAPKLQDPTASPSAMGGAQKLFGGAFKLRPPGEEPPPGGVTVTDGPPPDPAAAGLSKMLTAPKLQAPGLDQAGQGLEASRGMADAQDKYQAAPKRAPAIVMPSGERIEVDPRERERYQQEQNEEKAARLERLLSSGNVSGDVRAQAEAQLLAIRGGLNGQQSAAISNASAQQSGQDFKAAEADKHDMTAKEKFAAAMRPRGSGGRPVSASQKADDERADVNSWNTNYNSWEKAANVDKLTDDTNKFSQMHAAVQNAKTTGDVIAQRQALYTAARYITGPGVLTEQEYGNTVSHTGGLIASALSKVTKGLYGTISPQEEAALDKFVENANRSIYQRNIKSVQNFDKRFGSGYFAQHAPGEVAASRAAIMDRFGLSDEDLASAAPARSPSSKAPPAKAQPPGVKSPAFGGDGGAPAANASPAADPRILEWAKANPGDEAAQKYLKKFGGR